MNIPYELWPIWCDYLEEQGQETELLRYVMEYQGWHRNFANNGLILDSSIFTHGMSTFIFYDLRDVGNGLISFGNGYDFVYCDYEDKIYGDAFDASSIYGHGIDGCFEYSYSRIEETELYD